MKRIHYPLTAVLLTLGLAAQADKVDDYIASQIRSHRIPGLSLAIIDGGKIVKARGYGVTDTRSHTPVTADTLFQAGSISKAVTALGALRLVEQGRLSLDEDVNTKLTSWKVPDNAFTLREKVTLRRLLSHTAGMTVHGFDGYAAGKPRPTLVQVLNGEKPANSPPVRVDTVPGSKWRYSGGGYTVVQQLMQDVTGDSFPAFMQRNVLAPLGMSQSSYRQPLPPEQARFAATGHGPDGVPVAGRWHIYPEMAAAGLWTTASDLARFAIGVQRSLAGTASPVISQAMTRQMLTNQKDNDGLGLFLRGSGHTLIFQHNGVDEGFDAMLTAYAEAGKGAAIMVNANSSPSLVSHLLEAIARQYNWPDYPLTPEYNPIPDREPAVTADLRRLFVRLSHGALDRARFTSELASHLAERIKAGVSQQLSSLGPVETFTLVERASPAGARAYRYRVEFKDKNATLMLHCSFKAAGKIDKLTVRPE